MERLVGIEPRWFSSKGFFVHIPDGLVSPLMYLPAYGVLGVLWYAALQRVRRVLNEETLPWIAALTAFSFILMLITFPLPGGSSVHATGIPLLAVQFGVWVSFLAASLVLLIQALLLGDGGITTLSLNALAMAFVGSATARLVYLSLRPFHRDVALFSSAFVSVLLSSLLMAVVLGVQPWMGSSPDGTPLYFPFGLEVTVPALVIPHLFLGVGEGFLTVAGARFIHRMGCGES